MADSPYGSGIVGLLKKGFHNVPGVMGSSLFGLIGAGLFGYVIYLSKTRGVLPSKYKRDYIVVRPDDPRVNAPVRTYPL